MTKFSHKRRFAAALAAAAVLSCGRDEPKRASGREGADATGATPIFATFQGEPLELEAGLPSFRADAVDRELAWALAHCRCLTGTVGALARSQALRRGALPQILVPDVREQIRNDERLKALTELPPLLSGLGGLVADLLVTDEKIASDVRAATAEKLSRALPRGTRLGTTLAFRFDMFAPLGSATSGEPRSFAVADRAAFWSLVTAVPNLWETDAPLALGDHGLQLLHTAIMLSEWKYIFGLSEGGGLVVRADAGTSGKPGALDPRKEKGVAAYVSGTYTIAYPTGGNAIDLAINTRETWSRRPEAAPLDEQAMLLAAAAQAFKRLRPEARTRIASLFTADGLLPANVHELPLAFLATIGPLLQTRFIDADARKVRAFADGEEQASLRALARLIRALNLWVVELADLENAIPDPAQRADLTQGREGLLEALRLAMQIILRDHVAATSGSDGTPWLGLVTGGQEVGLAEAAEVLATLADTAGALDSPFLRERLASLFHWLMARRLATLGTTADADALSVVWAVGAVRAAQRLYGDDTKDLAWLDAAEATLAAVLERADATGGTP